MSPRQLREGPVASPLENMLACFHCLTWLFLSASHRGQQSTVTAVFITIELFLLREEVDSRKEQVSDMPTSWLC